MADRTAVDVANQALSHYGEPPIVRLTDNDRVSRIMNAQYVGARQRTLSLGFWKFAMKRVTLAEVSSAGGVDYTYAWQMPADKMRLFRVEKLRAQRFDIRGQLLFTDFTPAVIHYIRDVTEISQWDPLGVDVLSYIWAAATVGGVKRDHSLAPGLLQQATFWLEQALANDALELPPPEDETGALWEDSRWVGTSGAWGA